MVIDPASRDKASGIHDADLPREFLRRCQDRCGQRDVCMASDSVASNSSVASDSSVASASAAIACVASASVPPRHDKAHVAPHSVQLPAVLGVRSQREAPERTDARACERTDKRIRRASEKKLLA